MRTIRALTIASAIAAVLPNAAAAQHGRQFKDAWFWGSNWWEAKSIDKELLEYLARNMYPRKDYIYWPDSQRPTKGEYERAIRTLGMKVGIDFTGRTLEFEDD